MEIREDDLQGAEIAALLREHLDHMHSITPPESVHALDIEALRGPHITFWSAWENGELLGCGALLELDPGHAEIKSLRTSHRHRRRGVALRLLGHLLTEAERRSYRRLSLETGSGDDFQPARSLYRSYGFVPCRPFADYTEDPNSIFMTLDLTKILARPRRVPTP